MVPVDLAATGDGTGVVVGGDDGCLVRLDLPALTPRWRTAPHDAAIVRVVLVGQNGDEQVVSLDHSGRMVWTDPATGTLAGSRVLPGCPRSPHHAHDLEVSADGQHLVARCLCPLDPHLVATFDALAVRGITVGVHDAGGPAVLLDRSGDVVRYVADLKRPFALGMGTRAASLRAPGHWIGVTDLLTGDAVAFCDHCYERGGYAVAFSADERYVAWSGYEKYGARPEDREFVRLVRADVREQYGRDVLRGEYEFTDLRFSADAGWLVAGDQDGAISVVRLSGDGIGPRVIGRVTEEVAALVVTPPGQRHTRVVALGTSGELCCWSLPD